MGLHNGSRRALYVAAPESAYGTSEKCSVAWPRLDRRGLYYESELKILRSAWVWLTPG
jgi:hypothetical protein